MRNTLETQNKARGRIKGFPLGYRLAKMNGLMVWLGVHQS